ncbi:MAG: hypothetical protein WA220_06395 [Candidatus Nitrosopolaris sp.]
MIQCGGYGNLPPFKQITEINKFSEFLKNCEEPWHFAKAEETTDLLAKTGFKNIDVALSNECAKLVEHTRYSSFMKTVVMKPFLDYLTNYELIELVIDKVVQTTKNNNKYLC